MQKFAFVFAGVTTSTLLVLVFAGCLATGSVPGQGYARSGTAPALATGIFADDYDYYPGYEVYYSRNRHEYVYRDGNDWVRRPEPRGVSLSVLRAAPSVRLDFHDTPENHHDSVVKSYPKNWRSPAKSPDKQNARPEAAKGDPKNEKKGDQKDDGRKDQDDHRPDDSRRN